MLSFAAGPAYGYYSPDYAFTPFPEIAESSKDPYKQAGAKDPRAEVGMAEVHDCFTPTEIMICRCPASPGSRSHISYIDEHHFLV